MSARAIRPAQSGGVQQTGHVPGRGSLGLVVLLQLFAALEAAGDMERLVLRAHGGCVGGQVASGGDQEDPVAGQLELAEGRLDALDRVEVAVLAKQSGAERGLQKTRLPARGEVGGDESARLVDLLLVVEQLRERREQLGGIAGALRV